MRPTSASRLVAASAFVLLVTIASAPSDAASAWPQAGDKPLAGPSFTDEQSGRGETIYAKQCGPCHDDKSLAPLLTGDPFLKNWGDKTVAALFEKIRTTMPLQDPGTLSAQQSLDLTAYILKMNQFSGGSEALAKDGRGWGDLLRRVE